MFNAVMRHVLSVFYLIASLKRYPVYKNKKPPRGRFRLRKYRIDLVVVAEAHIIARTDLAHTVCLVLATTVGAEGLICNVDAFDKYH